VVLTALLFGGGAAWTLGRTTPSSATGRAAFGRVTGSHRIAGMLLASQVAFALVLVSGAFLVARSYITLFRIAPGFDVADTLTMKLTLPKGRYASSAAHARFVDRLLEEISARPGVASAGVVSDLPFVGNQMKFAVRVDAATAAQPGGPRQMEAGVRIADPGYFTTLRIPLVNGRYFGRDDRTGSVPVAVVNRTAADVLFSGSAIDRAISISEEGPRTIIGVVGDIKHAGLQTDEGPVIYVPYAQKSFDFANWLGVVVRGTAAGTNAGTIKAAVAAVDPSQPVADIMMMDDYLARARAPYRFSSLVVGCLAGAAFVLALAGIYGLTAFIVGTRIRELGVRLALGASAGSVVALVLRQVGTLIGAGLSAGLFGALAAATLLRSTVLGVGTPDPWIVAGAVLFLAAGGAMAGLAPALRAGRIDPTAALKAE
jgi:predicted permease